MAICDFCNDKCDGIRYPADTVKAAAASGFRPAGPMATGDEVARRLGISEWPPTFAPRKRRWRLFGRG
jgi:hypothetical protein